MFKSLLSTSSLNIINVTIIIISASLLAASIARGEVIENKYSQTIELSTRNSKKRNIAEIDYMQPVFSRENALVAVDLKLKVDNNKSKEINLGLVYRHNFEDKVIFGAYSYFDNKRTGNNFAVNGITPGVELLSKYVDFRANYYLPQNKRKKIQHNNKKQAKLQGTSIFAVSGGHTYEYALRGYDIEVGGAVFGFSDNLNEKFGTKLFVARYDFRNKHTKNITGTRVRLEQKLGRIQLNDNAMHFTLNAETQFDKIRKRQNFIGLSAKFAFGENSKQTGLKARMMDTVIRDVDIVTESEKAAQQISNFVTEDGRVIKKMYYVGGANSNYKGDGTAGSPLSLEQLKQMDISDAIVVVTTIDSSKGGKAISTNEYESLKALPQVVNGKKEINLVSTAAGADSITIIIKGDKGVSIDSNDHVNTTIIADFAAPATSNIDNTKTQRTASSQEAPTITLVEPAVEQEINTQVVIHDQLQSQIAEALPLNGRVEEAPRVEAVRINEAERAAAEARRVEADRIEAERVREAERVEAERVAQENVRRAAEARTQVLADAQARVLTANQALVLAQNAGDPVAIANATEEILIAGLSKLRVAAEILANALTAGNQEAINAAETEVQNASNIIAKHPINALNTFDSGIDRNTLQQNDQNYSDLIAENVGVGGKYPKDVTIVSPLYRLKAKYSALAKKLFGTVIKGKVDPNHNQDFTVLARNPGLQHIILEYNTQARAEHDIIKPLYPRLSRKVHGEIEIEKPVREQERDIQNNLLDNQRMILDGEISGSGQTRINENLAGHGRLASLIEISNDLDESTNHFYTEKLTGRLNTNEILRITVKRLLDAKKIIYGLIIPNKPIYY